MFWLSKFSQFPIITQHFRYAFFVEEIFFIFDFHVLGRILRIFIYIFGSGVLYNVKYKGKPDRNQDLGILMLDILKTFRKLRGSIPGTAKSNRVQYDLGMKSESHSRMNIVIVIVPASSSNYFSQPGLGAFRIFNGTLGVRGEPVGDPFPDVSTHMVKSESSGLQAIHNISTWFKR